MRARLLLLGALVPIAPAQSTPPGAAELLALGTDLDRLWQPVPDGERLQLFSSHDRRSQSGPEIEADWHANEDAGQFLRLDFRDERPEYVLAEATGPGCIVRLWCESRAGRLQVYVDGAGTPVWTLDLDPAARLEVDPFAPPLGERRGGAATSWLPIPFQRGIRVTTTDPDLRYEVAIRALPGIELRPFAAADAKQAAAAGPSRPPALAPTATIAGELPGDVELAADGPVVVRGWRVRFEPAPDLPAGVALRRTLVVVQVDGHETARVPLGDLFGVVTELRPLDGIALQVGADRVATCRFPIPARQAVRLRLVGEGEGPIGRATLEWQTEAGEVAVGALTWHAAWHQQRSVRPRPHAAHALLETDGPGRFAGCAMVGRSSVKSWWGEGDLRLWCDGDEVPGWAGTGTDDHFGFRAGAAPLEVGGGLRQRDGPGSLGYVAMLRVQLADSVPFRSRIRAEWELSPRHEATGLDVATVAYWYAPAATAPRLPPMPPVGERLPVTTPVPPVRRVPGALEAEALEPIAIGGGRLSREDMRGFDGDWSDGTQLAWRGAEPGDRLELPLPVPSAGRYRVRVVLTHAPDHAMLLLRVAGQPIDRVIDLHDLRARPGVPLDLGTFDLPAGRSSWTLELTGRNARARPEYSVGIDYLLLEPIR
jgi:hypothetical protein